MLLTDDEIMDTNQNAEFDSAIGYARAIESAVLEKLKAQTPVGSVYRNVVTGDFELLAYDDANHPKGTYSDIYTDPLPPDDVVRDADRYRWLRSQGYGGYAICKWDNGAGDYFRCIAPAETLDAAIDAAMKEMK